MSAVSQPMAAAFEVRDSSAPMPAELWTEARAVIARMLLREYRRRHGLDVKKP